MRSRTDLYVYLTVAALALAVLGYSLNFEYFSAKILPLVFAGLTLVLAVIGAVRSLMPRKPEPAKGAEPGQTENAAREAEGNTGQSWRTFLTTAAWVGGYYLCLTLLGFMIANAAFLLSYMRVHGSGWRQALVVTVVATAVIYLGMVVGFRVTLYRGLLFGA